MRIASWNVNSWTPSNCETRITLLSALKPDIICLQETKLLPGDKINVDGYKWIPFNRTYVRRTAKTGSGGIGILVKKSMYDVFSVDIIDKQYEGILRIKLTNKFSGCAFIIGCCYLPPEGGYWGRDAQSYFDHVLCGIYGSVDTELQLYFGDVNARIADNKDFIESVDHVCERKWIDCGKNKHGETFLDFLHEAKFCVVNGRVGETDVWTSVTSKGRSVVDYCFVPHQVLQNIETYSIYSPRQLCNDLGYIPDGSVPDHSILCLDLLTHDTINVTVPMTQSPGSQTRPQVRKRIRTPLPNDFITSEETQQLITQTIIRLENESNNQDDIDLLYQDVCDIYYNDLKSNAPHCLGTVSKKRYKHRPKPWWNDELSALWQSLLKAENTYKAYNGERVIKRRLLEQFRCAQKVFDKKYRRSKREFQRKQQDEIEQLNTNDPKKFWEKVKSLGPNFNKAIPMEILREDGTVCNDFNEVLEKWRHDYELLFDDSTNEHDFDADFLNLVRDENKQTEHAMISHHVNDIHSVMRDPITEQEVSKTVKAAKSGKAAGVDGLPNEVYKNQSSIEMLLRLFNKCFLSGLIPTTWKKAVIKPIPKGSKYNPRVPLNYRGISLLPTMYKLYTSILNTRAVSWLEENNGFVEEQNGFRKDRSCMEHLYSLTSLIRNRKNMKKSTYSCFIDMKKAFDSVNHDCLFNRLLHSGICDKLYWSIKSLYSSPISAVNDHLTDWFSIKSGVRQGDNLSTTLFALFINDLAVKLKESGCGAEFDTEKLSCLLYADDIVILADTEQELQTLLDIVYDWTRKWRLLINYGKTKVVHFRPLSFPRSDVVFKCGPTQLEYIDSYRYLGCELNQFLDFSHTAKVLAEASGRAIGSIVNKHKNSGGFHYNVYKKLYDTCVQPIMDYCGAVWGFKDFDKCNVMQNRALRAFLGLHRFAPVLAVQGDTAWTPPVIRRHADMIRLWHRIVSMPGYRLPHKIYNWERSINKKNWYTDLVHVFSAIGKPDIIDTPDPDMINIKSLVKEGIDCLLARHIRQWENDVQAAPKLRTYILCKNNWQCENYLNVKLTRQQLSLMAQLRCGILPLRIETGRYGPKPLKPEERICQLCNKDPETEIHFLFSCDKYADLREQFFNEISNMHNDFMSYDVNEKFKLIMTDGTIIKKTAAFINECYTRRSAMLYRTSDI